MTNLLDDFLVTLVLLVSAGYLIATLGPRSLRLRFLQAVSGLLRKAPTFLRLGGLAQRTAAAATLKAEGSCGGCDNCGSEQTQTRPAPPTEIKVPVEKIGHRLNH